MKFATITAIASIVASTQAVIVYVTEHTHVTVTEYPGQQVASIAVQPAPVETSSAAPAPAPPTVTPAAQGNAKQANDVVEVVHTDFVNADGQQADAPASPAPAAPAVETSSPAPAKPAASPAPAPAQPDLNSYASNCVSSHNDDRSKHSAPSVAWNQTLADYAQSYLNNQNCVFAHSGGPYGENIAMGYSTEDDAIAAWYNEVSQYSFSAGEFSDATGHFTQIVWKASTQIGCASVDCGSSGSFMACEYYPRGNIIGEFLENVFAN